MRTEIKNKNTKVTEREYQTLQKAFDTFNDNLFDGTLPQCLITLKVQANSKGFFSPDQFSGRKLDEKVHEIALNPDSFANSTDEQILSNLVHEMAHLWNHCSEIPTRPSYHSKYWARKMVEIGLQPISYDRENSTTGYHVDHEIIENGRFQKIAHQLLNKGIEFNWQSIKVSNNNDENRKTFCTKKREDTSKVGFSCPECLQKAWAKSTANLICGHCNKRMMTKTEILDLHKT